MEFTFGQIFIASLAPFVFNLLKLLIAVILVMVLIQLVDKYVYKNINFEEQLQKDNVAVGIVVGCLVFGMFYLIAYILG